MTRWAWIWPTLAAIISLGVGTIELGAGGRKSPTRSATPWIILRCFVDTVVALAAYSVVLKAATHSLPKPIVAVAAGLVGVAALRTSISLDSGHGRRISISPEYAYRKIQQRIDTEIDVRGATAGANWVTSQLLPTLHEIPFNEFALRTKVYFLYRDFTDSERKTENAFITKLANSSNDEDSKRLDLLNHLIERGDQVFLRSFLDKRIPKKPLKEGDTSTLKETPPNVEKEPS